MSGCYVTDEWLHERTGAHRTTIARWRQERCIPPAVVRLAALELDGQLELVHPDWIGWQLNAVSGELEAPAGYPTFTPSALIAYPLRLQQIAALELELAALRVSTSSREAERLAARLSEISAELSSLSWAARRLHATRRVDAGDVAELRAAAAA